MNGLPCDLSDNIPHGEFDASNRMRSHPVVSSVVGRSCLHFEYKPLEIEWILP